MITYSSMTLMQAIDEIMLRVRKLSTTANFDRQLAVMYLNRARRTAMAMSLPTKDWAYVKTVAIANGTEIPQDFVRGLRVMLKDPSATDYTSARKIAPEEWWTFTNTHRAHSYNAATNSFPVFTLWGSDDSSTLAWNSKGLIIKVAPSTVTGTMEYYAEYPDMSQESETLNVPYETENLVILLALVSIYNKLGEQSKAVETYKQYQKGIMEIRQNDIQMRQIEGINLQSQASSLPTNIRN